MTKPVTILVTGFGPFDGNGPGNLSYSIVTTLPKFLPPSQTCSTPVRIIVHPYGLPVSFNELRSLVPRLYDAYSHEVDMWLHFGMRPEQDSYSVEQTGRRGGYQESEDITGETLPKDDGDVFFHGCPSELETTLAVDDIFSRWRSKLLDSPEVSPQLGGVRIRKSRDPGHFICDFFYYSVLAEHWRRKKDAVDGARPMTLMPVLFMNVPVKNTQEQLRRARHVTINLIQAMAESWRANISSQDAAQGS